MKASNFFFVLFLSSGIVSAGTNTLKLPNENENYTVHQQDLNPSLFNPGDPGENQIWIWNLDSLHTFRTVNVSVLSADMFNLSGNLKDADLIIENEFVSANDLSFGHKHYFIYEIKNDGLIKLGRIDTDTVSKVSNSVYFDDSEIRTNGLIYYNQKISDAWSASYTIPNTSTKVTWSNGSSEYHVDARGELRINGEVFPDVYRIKRTKVYVESGNSPTDINHQYISFEWWSENVPMPIIVMELHTTSDSTKEYTLSYLDKSHYVIQGIDLADNETLNFEAYPNPSNGQIRLKYESKSSGNLQMTLFDVTGNRIKEIEDQFIMPGTYVKELNLHVESGIYYIRTFINGKTLTKKLVIT